MAASYKIGRWDLSALADDPQSDVIKKMTRKTILASKRFEKNNRESLNPNITQAEFEKMISEIEQIYKSMSILGGYASLLYSSDTQSDVATSLVSATSKIASDISNKLIFFDLWWKNTLDQKNAQRLVKNIGELADYLSHKRRLADYSLEESEEKIINTLDVTGASALIRLYDKITNAYEYVMKIHDKTKVMTREEITNLVRVSDTKTRRTAYQTMLAVYAKGKGVTGSIYQDVVRNWYDECIEMRGYATPISVRNTANDLEDKTVNVLLDTCKKNALIFQEFFTQKAKMLGMKQLKRYDVYAPVATDAKAENKKYTFGAAARLVLESLGGFSPELGTHAKRVFDESHIDSAVRHGKRDGAFCSTVIPEIAPYILLNYTGRTRDVFTLAHEMGHAVHSLAAQDRSILVQEAPLPLAETASTFSELLLYETISNRIPDSDKSRILFEKIDDMYATIMRQAFFTLFEIKAHKQIASGEGGSPTTIQDITDTYLENLYMQFGKSVDVTDDFGVEWCAIPHFYHSPFYCYAYSFGNLLSLSLFQRYMKEGKDLVPSYMGILSAGGSKKPEDLLSEYGFDIGSRKFWQEGFDYARKQVQTLGQL